MPSTSNPGARFPADGTRVEEFSLGVPPAITPHPSLAQESTLMIFPNNGKCSWYMHCWNNQNQYVHFAGILRDVVWEKGNIVEEVLLGNFE